MSDETNFPDRIRNLILEFYRGNLCHTPDGVREFIEELRGMTKSFEDINPDNVDMRNALQVVHDQIDLLEKDLHPIKKPDFEATHATWQEALAGLLSESTLGAIQTTLPKLAQREIGDLLVAMGTTINRQSSASTLRIEANPRAGLWFSKLHVFGELADEASYHSLPEAVVKMFVAACQNEVDKRRDRSTDVPSDIERSNIDETYDAWAKELTMGYVELHRRKAAEQWNNTNPMLEMLSGGDRCKNKNN